MYLTKFSLDPRHPSVRQCLRDCHDMHRTVMKAFPDSVDRLGGSVLFRLMTPKNESPILYLSSSLEPNASRLEENGFRALAVREISALRQAFVSGSCWRFDLLVCPSKKIQIEGRRNSPRVCLYRPEEQDIWMQNKADQNGYRLLSYTANGQSRIYGRRGGVPLTFSAFRFCGLLRITDAQKLWDGYCHGIGPERAYGMGMLMLTRP